MVKPDFLVLIPARGGSKGVPKKNVKPFAGKESLIERSISTALACFDKSQIIVSSDDEIALQQASVKGVVAHERNPDLAKDSSGMLEVMIDVIENYRQNQNYLVLLQATSPFRTPEHIEKALCLIEGDTQAVVSVNEPKGHPFYTLFEQHGKYIQKFQSNAIVRRQDLPAVYDVNGLLYIFHIPSLLKQSWVEFERIIPFPISHWEATDIDTLEDWILAEILEQNKSLFNQQ